MSENTRGEAGLRPRGGRRRPWPFVGNCAILDEGVDELQFSGEAIAAERPPPTRPAMRGMAEQQPGIGNLETFWESDGLTPEQTRRHARRVEAWEERNRRNLALGRPPNFWEPQPPRRGITEESRRAIIARVAKQGLGRVRKSGYTRTPTGASAADRGGR